jgi:hypothetical protein
MANDDDQYAGPFSPADAMSALDPVFDAAYAKASGTIMDAVLEFERVTRRVVDTASVHHIDVTTMASPKRVTVRQASLHFLPRPDEVVSSDGAAIDAEPPA